MAEEPEPLVGLMTRVALLLPLALLPREADTVLAEVALGAGPGGTRPGHALSVQAHLVAATGRPNAGTWVAEEVAEMNAELTQNNT